MLLRPSQLLLYATVFVLIIGGGVVYGVMTDRWLPVDQEAALTLDRLPMSIDEWEGAPVDSSDDLPDSSSTSTLLRRYVHRGNGTAVTLFLTSGRSGPIVAAHMPDSCYIGAGYRFSQPMVKHTVPVGSEGQKQEFRVATFSKTDRAMPVHLRVYWGWSATGQWRMPDNPRFAFAGQRRLYKMYVVHQLPNSNVPLEGDPAEAFIQALSPVMERVFFAKP